MYGIFTYIWLIFKVYVGKYAIHGSYGLLNKSVDHHKIQPKKKNNNVLDTNTSVVDLKQHQLS